MATKTLIQQLADIVSTVLVPRGYERKGRNWYRDGDGVTVIYHIDKSQFAQRFSSDVGFWLHAFTPADLVVSAEDPEIVMPAPHRPKGYQCPIGFSTPQFDEATYIDIHRALDLGPDDVFDDSRREVIVDHLERVVVPLLESGSSVTGLAAMLRQGRLENGLVHHLARTYLASH